MIRFPVLELAVFGHSDIFHLSLLFAAGIKAGNDCGQENYPTGLESHCFPMLSVLNLPRSGALPPTFT